MAASAGVVAAAGYGYMRWLEPRWLATRRVEVPMPRGTSGAAGGKPIRLLHLSDFHASEDIPLEFVASAVTAGLALRPDLICLTGDFITWRHDGFNRYAEILKPLSAAAPAFAVLGNHDGGLWVGTAGYPDTELVRGMLGSAGISLLHNRSVEIDVQGRRIQLTGVGDLWAGEMDGDLAFSSGPARAPDAVRVLLSHNPDSKEALGRHPWDLMLSGHTHGGQCDLVFFGTPFAPVRDKRYVRGLRRWQDRWIHVSAGVGNLHGMRFNCRPEVSLLTLV